MDRQGVFADVWSWLAKSRGHRVLCLVLGLWTVNLFDLVLTLTAHRQGLLHEANPIAAVLLSRGPQAVCLFKFCLVAAGSIILIRYRRHLSAELAAGSLLAVYALVAVQWKWCYELYVLAHTSDATNSELAEMGSWALELPPF